MTFFPPPTDNLYKFMAILGLLLWIGGTVYPWTKAYELEYQVIELQADVKHAKRDPDHADVIELEKKLDQIRLTFRAVVGLFIFGLFSMAVGGWLMYRGSTLWYQRVQVPMDRELFNRSAAPNNSLNPDAPQERRTD